MVTKNWLLTFSLRFAQVQTLPSRTISKVLRVIGHFSLFIRSKLEGRAKPSIRFSTYQAAVDRADRSCQPLARGRGNTLVVAGIWSSKFDLPREVPSGNQATGCYSFFKSLCATHRRFIQPCSTVNFANHQRILRLAGILGGKKKCRLQC